MRSKTKTKAKATRRKKAAKTTPLTLIARVYALLKGSNFHSEYTITTDGEQVTCYPKNAFAEKIVVSSTRFDVAETRIQMHRIHAGDKDISLDVISDGGVRTELSALHLIKNELKRYC